MKVYVYIIGDIYVYLADGEMDTTLDVSDTDMFEDGIRIAGGTLVEIEATEELTGNFNVENADEVDEKAFEQRLLKHIEENNL